MPVELGSEPTGLFQECIPVVVTGKVLRADDGSRYFAGNEVIVKHDNEYDAENEGRLDDANAEAAACLQRG
jgi:cytochrome c-type biogenesis protein CcmE